MDKILPHLRKNARASIADLAKAANLSEAEVTERIAKLEASGVILGYQAIVDPEKTAGEQVTAVIEVKITPERDGGFNKMAERIPTFFPAHRKALLFRSGIKTAASAAISTPRLSRKSAWKTAANIQNAAASKTSTAAASAERIISPSLLS